MKANGAVSMETAAAAIKMAASDAPVRIAMRGSSMLPDVGDGMLLEIDNRDPQIGDIAVFRAGSRLVAHRVIRRKDGVLICAGDAQPDSLEHVSRDQIVGTVRAIFNADGQRADVALARLRGFLRAVLRPLRAIAVRSLPHLRVRSYATLTGVMSAIVREDAAAFASCIRKDLPWRLAAMAQRHRCAAALAAAVERAGDEYAVTLSVKLRKARWSALVRNARMSGQTSHVVHVLRAAGIEPVLLKGAHRIATGVPEAMLYDSQDIDVLVAVDRVEDACRALRDSGYRQSEERGTMDYRRHHHAAPLTPAEGLSVEVHRALSKCVDGIPNDYNALRGYIIMANTSSGAISVLDPVATTLHLAMHCVPRPALRELVLLAVQLRRLDSYEMARFCGLLSRTGGNAVPLRAAVLLAAKIAGISWSSDPNVERFAKWMLEREDLPRPLRARPNCVDAWLGSDTPLRAALSAALEAGCARGSLRIAAGLGIALYTCFMR